jgi:hypothetical protein
VCPYTKAMQNVSDKTGTITIDTLKLGEYALAMKDYLHGIQNTKKETGMIVFPNPGDESITVKFSGTEISGDVFLLDTLGKTVWKDKMRNGNELNIRTKNMPAGNYTISLENSDGRRDTQKVIIAH